MVPQAGIEPASPASEAGGLSVSLLGHKELRWMNRSDAPCPSVVRHRRMKAGIQWRCCVHLPSSYEGKPKNAIAFCVVWRSTSSKEIPFNLAMSRATSST